MIRWRVSLGFSKANTDLSSQPHFRAIHGSAEAPMASILAAAKPQKRDADTKLAPGRLSVLELARNSGRRRGVPPAGPGAEELLRMEASVPDAGLRGSEGPAADPQESSADAAAGGGRADQGAGEPGIRLRPARSSAGPSRRRTSLALHNRLGAELRRLRARLERHPRRHRGRPLLFGQGAVGHCGPRAAAFRPPSPVRRRPGCLCSGRRQPPSAGGLG